MTDGTGTSSWSFDSLHRLTQSTSGLGQTVSYGYDLKGQVTSIAYPGGSCSTPATRCVTRGYFDNGQLKSVTDFAGQTTTFGYDADSDLQTQTNPNQTSSTLSYDNADRLTGMTHSRSGNAFASLGYPGRDNNDQLTSVTSSGVPADAHTYGYSRLNQLTQVTTPAQPSTTYGYDQADNLTQLADGTTQQSFDAGSELINSYNIGLVGKGSYTNASSSTATVTFTQPAVAQDQILVAATQPSTATPATPSGYTLVGNWSAGSVPATTTYLYRKQAAGGEAAVSISYGLVPTPTSVVAAVYRGVDPANPIDAQTATTGSGTSISAGPLTTTLPGDRLVLFAGAGNTGLAAHTWSPQPPLNEQIQASSAQTAADLADETIPAAGSTGVPLPTSPVTDNLNSSGNLIGVLVALKPAPTIYDHDPHGNRTKTTPPTGPTSSYRYDQANRLTTFAQGSTSASYRYRGDGLRMSKTVGSSTQNFAWDETAGLPALLSDGTANYIYGPSGTPLEQVSAPPAIARMATGSGGDPGTDNLAPVSFNGFTAQAGDKILVASTQAGNQTNNVNTPAGATKLTPASSGTGATDTSTVVFLLTAKGGETGVSLTYTATVPFAKSIVAAVYRGPDTVTALDDQSPQHASGTTITAGPLNATLAGDQLVLFQGATGGVVGKTWTTTAPMTEQGQHNSGLTAAAIADQAPLATAGATGTRQATFGVSTKLAAVIVALKPPPAVLYYHQDQLGSTRALTNQAGTVVATATYDPYGKQTGSTVTAQLTNPFGYAGQYTDPETGLIYLRARYYDPATAQFLSRDPIVDLTRSAYGYVNGNPLNSTDPSGLRPWWKTVLSGVGAGAGLVAGGIAVVGIVGVSLPVDVALAGTVLTGVAIVSAVLDTYDACSADTKSFGCISGLATLGFTAVGIGAARQLVKLGPAARAIGTGALAAANFALAWLGLTQTVRDMTSPAYGDTLSSTAGC